MLVNRININYNNVNFRKNKQSFNASSKSNSSHLSEELNILSNKNKYLINFRGAKPQKDNFSYENFIICSQRSGIIDLEKLKENIREENLMGSGANSKVYHFDDPRLDNWVIKVDKKPFSHNKNYQGFHKTDDEFGDINMGQEIARIGDRYSILKKITGKIHSISDWSNRISNNLPITKEDSLEFLNSIQKIANFDQSTFDDYASQLAFLTTIDRKQDSINPNNILIDYETGKLNIIDTFKKVHPAHTNSRLDLIVILLDFSFFDKFYANLNAEEQESMRKNAKTIVEKCNIASQKYNIPQDETTFLKYLEEVDKWFGCYLEDGDYTARYNRLKNIIPELVQ